MTKLAIFLDYEKITFISRKLGPMTNKGKREALNTQQQRPAIFFVSI